MLKFSLSNNNNNIQFPSYRIPKYKHNPYVGTFHCTRYINATEDVPCIFIESSSGNLPRIRHSPPASKVIIRPLTVSKPFASQLDVKRPALIDNHLNESCLLKFPIFRFGEANPSCDNDDPQCPICLDLFEDGDEMRSLGCGHCFHKECIDTWLLGSKSHDEIITSVCPTCRRSISPSKKAQTPSISNSTSIEIGMEQSQESLRSNENCIPVLSEQFESPVDNSNEALAFRNLRPLEDKGNNESQTFLLYNNSSEISSCESLQSLESITVQMESMSFGVSDPVSPVIDVDSWETVSTCSSCHSSEYSDCGVPLYQL